MKLAHWMKRERSGLAFTTAELVAEEQKQGHSIFVREPGGNVLYGQPFDDADVELVHSQLPIQSYHNGKPKLMWMHGEAISSVGNGVSMKAICDLAPMMEAFICMRREEIDYWQLIKRTYLVPKGIDLETYKPLPATAVEKLSGSPAVLYMEHWRQSRNPLPLVVAMSKVWKRYPDARLHLFNCTDQKMLDTFKALVGAGKLWTYVRSLQGPVKPGPDVNTLLNRADIVVSCLTPFYARSIEALGAGKAFLCPGYTDSTYPWHCTLDPESMADEICRIWENYDSFNYRRHAEQNHDVKETVRQSIGIYGRYVT